MRSLPARLFLVSLGLSLLLVPTAHAWWGECDLTEPRSANFEAVDARWIEIRAAAGSLRVDGVPDTGRIEATGTACSSDSGLLREVRLEIDREGDGIVVAVLLPERRRETAALDLEVLVPNDLPIRIFDTSGDLEVFDLASVALVDGSGDVRIRRVAGPVRIEDGSGGLDLEDIGGSVVIDDGSGELRMAEIGGSVEIEDGSGEISVVRVKGHVVVLTDGSGWIRARRIDGDFEVLRNGSGEIRTARIAGEIRLPRT